jgi:RNA polymerase sigma-70 factor (ECF subfamily)
MSHAVCVDPPPTRAERPTCEHADDLLVERLARADPEALGALYDRYGRTAYALARRILRDEHLAEDAVQEGFLCAWRLAPSFDRSQCTARGWILTLVHRRAVDLVRRGERRRAEPFPDGVEASEPGPDELAWARSCGRAVRSALDGLRSGDRHLLELAYFGGLTQTEIAARLDLPLGTVKSRTFAALSALRRALGDDRSLFL